MIDQIQPSQLPDWISSKSASGNTVVLDVREPYEVQTACVTANGFELVTLPMGSIVEKLSELDKDRPIACLCHHGSRSMQVAAYLSSQGFYTSRQHRRWYSRMVFASGPQCAYVLIFESIA